MRGWLVALSIVASVRAAHAEDAIVRGAIVKIEAQEVYISVGVDKGVSGGSAVRIKRTISLKHPVTHQTVQDWIPIGSASVTQAGAVMSRAVIGTLVDAVKVGDVAEVLVDRPELPAPAPKPAAPGAPPPPPVDPATAEVMGLFVAQSGQPIESRIAAWERYLSMRASSPYAAGIRRELDELHALRDEMRPPTSTPGVQAIATVEHEPPKMAIAGSQVSLVFVIDKPERVASGYLHYRPRGSRTYRSLLLVREHDMYLRGTLPADVVTPPGVDYFVEVSSPQGASGLALGSPGQPVAVDVAPPTILDKFGSAPGRSSVKLAADYLDFGTFDQRAGERTDRMFTANVDFVYRFHSLVESLGVGYGVYIGRGGVKDPMYDASNPVPHAGFHYGYADMEVGGRNEGVHISFGGRFIAGVGKPDQMTGEGGFGLGAEGRFRIGERDGTNLAFVARTIEHVGFLTDIRFGARPVDKMLIGISVGATNQPIQEDVAVKLGTEIEVLAVENVSLFLRGSWQGRSTKHSGIGAGAGLGVTW